MALLALVTEAIASGARQSEVCKVLGITARMLQRWRRAGDKVDGRLTARHHPANKLTEVERARILQLANEPAHVDLPPSQLVPVLADQGIYVASESSFYRVLRDHNQLQHRQRTQPPRPKPDELVATGPNQVYCWDITYLPTPVRGLYFYLYLIMDLFSRMIVGWQVYEKETATLAAELMIDTCQRQRVQPGQVTLHADNGGPMKGNTMLTTLQRLGVIPSFSRSAVSNDNPYAESLFRTLKYRPMYPEQAFPDIYAARRWVYGFVNWYNREHRHSGIQFVTPEQRHLGQHIAILAARDQLYQAARAQHPLRWSGSTRNWQATAVVSLNPGKQQRIRTAA